MNLQREINSLREKIDKITEKIIRLIGQRQRVVLEIGKIKRQLGLPIIDSQRDKEVFKKIKFIAGKEKIDFQIIEEIFRILIKHAKKIQKKQRD